MLQGAISSPTMALEKVRELCPDTNMRMEKTDRSKFRPLFDQELHRAGFCCKGHRRSVQEMRTLTEYQLPLRTSSEKTPPGSTVAQVPCNGERSAFHRAPQSSLVRERSKREEVNGRMELTSPLCKSRSLRTEETMLRCNLSKRQIDSVVAAAECMFKPVDPSTSGEAEHTKQWKDAMKLYSEHHELLGIVKCKQHQKRDNVAKAEISSRHPEVDKDVREGYSKIMQRLETFQEKIELPFPPNSGAFFRW